MTKRAKQQFDYLNPIIIGALAFILRLWNTIAQGNDFYANFLSDASTYRVWASKLAAGGSYGEPVFQMGPLYPYFLAQNLKLGISNYATLFIQAIFGALVAVMVYYIAKNMFDRKAALISGLIATIYAPFIFYDGLLLSESIQIFLLTVALFILISNFKKRFSAPSFSRGDFNRTDRTWPRYDTLFPIGACDILVNPIFQIESAR